MSVWVEMTDEEPTEEEPTGHAPRERVSWNENVCTDFQICCGHAPRERVSWNKTRTVNNLIAEKSRSTWACELK